MKAGSLRHRVTLQQLTISQGTSGDLVEAWGDVATLWAAVEPLSGREYWQAQQVAAETSIRVRIRYRDGLDTTMRVIYGTKTLEILSIVDPEERHRELQLMCRELKATESAP
jgi:SPP1 family predicted phage head-tail adaptor